MNVKLAKMKPCRPKRGLDKCSRARFINRNTSFKNMVSKQPDVKKKTSKEINFITHRHNILLSSVNKKSL